MQLDDNYLDGHLPPKIPPNRRPRQLQFRVTTVARGVLFSKRQRITLRLLYAMSRPSVCLSSVCDVGAPYSGG